MDLTAKLAIGSTTVNGRLSVRSEPNCIAAEVAFCIDAGMRKAAEKPLVRVAGTSVPPRSIWVPAVKMSLPVCCTVTRSPGLAKAGATRVSVAAAPSV